MFVQDSHQILCRAVAGLQMSANFSEFRLVFIKKPNLTVIFSCNLSF